MDARSTEPGALWTSPTSPPGGAALVAEAQEQLRVLEAELAELDRLEQDVGELRAALCPWDAGEATTLWQREAELPRREQDVAARVENVVSLLGQALELDPERSLARARLADLYWLLFCRAEERGDRARQDQLLALLALHDDGRYADLIEGTSTLQVETEPPGARVTLRSATAPARDLGPSPVDPVDLAPGSYWLTFELEGLAPTVRPIQVRRGVDLQLQVRLFSSREVGPDYSHVPAGRFRMGGDATAPGAGPSREAFVDNFAIARFPVTVGEYMQFIDALSASDPRQALRFSPLPAGEPFDPRLPVSGISREAALAYCSWLSARTGREHRLPSEQEWEKAARGLDGRAYPWGERFDPSLCQMRRSQPGPPRKRRVGSVPTDVSVFGVRDLAGGVAEWTGSGYGTAPDLWVVRGGGFDTGAESCRCATRIPSDGQAQLGIGFRLVRPLAPGGGDRVAPAAVPALFEPHEAQDPVTTPSIPVKQALEQTLTMSRRLAAGDAEALLPELLAETVRLTRAERGLLLRDGEVLEARTSSGEPLPGSDSGFDGEVARAAVRQRRAIHLAHPHPVLALPLPDLSTCLLLERRFHRSLPFEEEGLLVAGAAADALALALRLSQQT